VSFDLTVYGSEDRLVREVFDAPSIAAWSSGSGQLCLILDSLDEVRARVPQVGAVIADRLRRLPLDRLILRIACRTADWQAGFERSLKELFGEVEVVEILPLRRADASAIAAAWCDPSPFLDEVVRAGAGPLAARPLTLRFLARSFGRSGSLPGRGAALYAAGVRSLCEEQNTGRLDASLAGSLTLDQRVAVARRIAAATVFGGSSAVWTGPSVDADDEDIAVEHLAGGSEPTPSGPVEVTATTVREATRTGLFTSRGGQRLGFAHATFADFLAADWVVASDLSLEQARPLFLGPDGRCWPQTRLAGAWTVAIAPERFGDLAVADPSAFQGEVELPGDSLRAAVIDGLFSIANTLTAAPWERSYHTLRHRNVADQLRPHLRDIDADRRRLAFQLADECAAIDLRDELAAIALDVTAETPDRVAAGWALVHLPSPHRAGDLRALALDAAARGDDPDDELKGVALLASWPQAMSNAEVFSVLTSRRRRNYHGAYAIFLDRFGAGITADDVADGLLWLLDNLSMPLDDHIVGALANRVLTLAAIRPTDRLVVDAFARVALARVEHYEGLLFEDFRNNAHEDPLADPLLRRSVAAAVLSVHPTAKEVRQLRDDGLYGLGVVRSDDLAWLAEIYVQADSDLREAVRSLFQWTFDASNTEHGDLVLGMSHEHPLYVDLVGEWVEPVALDSPEADEMRRSWRASRRRQSAMRGKNGDVNKRDDVDNEIEELLARFDKGEAVGFWYSMRLLTVAPGSKYFGEEFDPDVVSMKRWPTLSEQLRERLVDAADNYLRSYSCESHQWLRKPETRYHPADAGYRAMILLLRLAPSRLRRLPTSAWIEWAPVLATWSTAFSNGGNWDDKMQLLQLAGPKARAVARIALLSRVDAAVGAGLQPFASNEADYLWDQVVASDYLSLARTAERGPREEIVTLLAKRDLGLVRDLLLEWLRDPSDGERQRYAATTLIDHDLERSWPTLKTVLDADVVIAEQVLGQALTVRGLQNADPVPVPASTRADIYLWLRVKFPPDSDPQFDEVHVVGPREQIGRWRDKLIGGLQGEGSPEAVDAVQTIVTALPSERWLARTLASAQATLRRSQWTPTLLPQLRRLASDRRTVVVNDAPGLATAVTSALDDIQTRLTGATPESHYLWDSHAGRPKSEDEISDYLANELSRALTTRGAIVNREVQIRRNRPSGIGERADLLIDATPAIECETRRLSLPVEVKGAWNGELRTAMRQQLVDRYMRDVAANDGIYIVAWPDLASWTDTNDERRSVLSSHDRQAVEAELAAQASTLAQEGVRVSVVHLSIDYRRHR